MMQVRNFDPSDAPLLAELGTERASHVLVRDGRMVGAAVVCGAVCHALFIVPAERRKGCGTYFVRQLMRLCAPDPLAFRAARDNTVAALFFAHVGLSASCDSAYPSRDAASAQDINTSPQGNPASPQHNRTPCENYSIPAPNSAHTAPPSEFDCFYTRSAPPQLDAVRVTHDFLRTWVRPGAAVLDATAGNGHDALFLAQLVGAQGSVTALDVQPAAVAATNARLQAHGCTWAHAKCDTHANLADYAPLHGFDAVMFNLGYLPGADHTLFTQPDVSVPAMRTALEHLRAGGVMTACLYAGGAQGTRERDAVLELLRSLPTAQYTVLICTFAGRGNSYPVPVCVLKTRK